MIKQDAVMIMFVCILQFLNRIQKIKIKKCADVHLPLPQRTADLISQGNAVISLTAWQGGAAGSRGAAAPGWGFCSIPPSGWKCKNLLRRGEGLRKQSLH